MLFPILGMAQDVARGVSEPGTLELDLGEDEPYGILCYIEYDDPSGDMELTKGEKGWVRVRVKNNTVDVIDPQLVLSVSSSWSPKAKNSMRRMEPLKPGEAEVYTASLVWDKHLPSGNISYKAVVKDNMSGQKTDPVETVFAILGGNELKKGAEFINVDTLIPQSGAYRQDDIAVVIGNQHYQNKDVPDVEYAINDAKIMKEYLVKTMGFAEENVFYYEDIGKNEFELIFGTKGYYQTKLYNWIKPHQSNVFIYYSGHGAPDMQNKDAYFMPVNSDPNYININGYPLKVLYENLAKMPTKSVTVVLDACFSGGSQQGMLIRHASPMFIKVDTPTLVTGLNILTSASGSQISSWYPEGNHSLFTYFLLRAMRGEADKNRDKKLTLREIQTYLHDQVPYTARRMYNREQTPGISGNLESVFSTY